MVDNDGLAAQPVLDSTSNLAPDGGPVLLHGEPRGFAHRLQILVVHALQSRWPVAAENPQHIGAILQSLGQIVCKEIRVAQVVISEEARACAPGRSQLVAPDGHSETYSPSEAASSTSAAIRSK